jgi:hypothetical protein
MGFIPRSLARTFRMDSTQRRWLAHFPYGFHLPVAKTVTGRKGTQKTGHAISLKDEVSIPRLVLNSACVDKVPTTQSAQRIKARLL